MTKIVSYKWMIKQINKLEDAIIKECGFCLGADKTPSIPTEFNETSVISSDSEVRVDEFTKPVR